MNIITKRSHKKCLCITKLLLIPYYLFRRLWKSGDYRDQTLHKSTCLLIDTSLSSLFILSSILVFYFYVVSNSSFYDEYDLNTSSEDIYVNVWYIFQSFWIPPSIIFNVTNSLPNRFNTRKKNNKSKTNPTWSILISKRYSFINFLV